MESLVQPSGQQLYVIKYHTCLPGTVVGSGRMLLYRNEQCRAWSSHLGTNLMWPVRTTHACCRGCSWIRTNALCSGEQWRAWYNHLGFDPTIWATTSCDLGSITGAISILCSGEQWRAWSNHLGTNSMWPGTTVLVSHTTVIGSLTQWLSTVKRLLLAWSNHLGTNFMWLGTTVLISHTTVVGSLTRWLSTTAFMHYGTVKRLLLAWSNHLGTNWQQWQGLQLPAAAEIFCKDLKWKDFKGL